MDSNPAQVEVVESKFNVSDYVVFCLLLAASLSIGVYSGIKTRGKESAQRYLLGGRAMSPYPVALSLIGGIVSAVSVLGRPTEVYLFGTQLSLMLIGIIPGCLFVHQLLPIFYNSDIVSLNQYLMLRYGSPALRKMASVCHIMTRFFYMSICLYAPSLALSIATGLPAWASVLTMGMVCTCYITLGGVKAVVYTDVLQTVLMFGGVLAVVIICCIDLGGLGNVWAISEQGGRIEFFNFDPSPFVRHTFWSTTVLGFYAIINTVGLNQDCYQRFASVGSLATAQRLSLVFMGGLWLLWGLFYLAGLVAYAAYKDCDPLLSGRIHKPDQILPYLVMDKLSHIPGLPGLFVAAVYSAVLSSVSSSGNSIACLVWEDLLKQLPTFNKMDGPTSMRVLRIISSIAGFLSTMVGLVAGRFGNIFQLTNSVTGTIMGPIQGVFLVGLFAPWVNTKGAVAGFLGAFTYNVCIVVGKFYRGGASPPRLSLSTERCPENFLNLQNDTTPYSTLLPSVQTFLLSNLTSAYSTVLPPAVNLLSESANIQPTTLNETLLATLMPSQSASPTSPLEDEGRTVYDVSYCYFGVTGITITIVISCLVSLCTGPLKPSDVDRKLVFKCSRRLYRRLYHACGGQDSGATDNAVQIPTSPSEKDPTTNKLLLEADTVTVTDATTNI